MRLFCELTLADVARATGLSPATVSAVEGGRRAPNDVERFILEKYLREKLECVIESNGPVPDWLYGIDSREVRIEGTNRGRD